MPGWACRRCWQVDVHGVKVRSTLAAGALERSMGAVLSYSSSSGLSAPTCFPSRERHAFEGRNVIQPIEADEQVLRPPSATAPDPGQY